MSVSINVPHDQNLLSRSACAPFSIADLIHAGAMGDMSGRPLVRAISPCRLGAQGQGFARLKVLSIRLWSVVTWIDEARRPGLLIEGENRRAQTRVSRGKPTYPKQRVSGGRT